MTEGIRGAVIVYTSIAKKQMEPCRCLSRPDNVHAGYFSE